MKKLLFVCSENRMRSLTAERMYDGFPGYVVKSAGNEKTARTPLTKEHIEWADMIFVMEKAHRNRLRKKFHAYLASQRVICLNIPDEYEYMDPHLVRLLKALVPRYLRHRGLCDGAGQ